jgi:predicted TIM-barrel fold metal-dependent hydrolase
MRRTGLNWADGPKPPTSDELARSLGAFFGYVIDCFSPARCMFESNLPPEKESCSVTVLWNAFKKLSRTYTPAERADLFEGTATRVYRLNED